MKLAILGSRGFPSSYGGYETLVRYLARYLVEHGHDVTVYGRARDEGRRTWRVEGVRCIATAGRDTKSLSTLTFGLTSTLDAAMRRYDAMLVLNIANGFWFPFLRLARVPFAVNTDGLEWERGKWSPTGRAVFKAGAWMTARGANQLICDSEAIGDVWRRRFGSDSVFIPYGAPVVGDPDSDRLRARGIDPASYALVVARLAPENNVDLALDALELIGDAAPRAVVVGNANFPSPTEERLAALHDAGRVCWLGHVDDQRLLEQLWANCLCYIHGHSVGGTNPALLQALGAGAPTIALDTVFNREILRNDEQLFRSDASHLAEQMMRLVVSDERRHRVRARGVDIIRTRYQWTDVCRRYADVLAGLARRG